MKNEKKAPIIIKPNDQKTKRKSSLFSLKNFTLSHDTPIDFIVSSWQFSGSPWPMLLLRLALATYSTSVCLWSMIGDSTCGSTLYWFIYFSNWGIMLLAIDTIYALAVSIGAVFITFSDMKSTPCAVGCYWILYNMTATITPLISLFYWTNLYFKEEDEPWYWISMDLATHAGNSVVVMVEVAVCQTPSRFEHLYQPCALALSFGIFTYIHHAVEGKDEYGFPYVYSQMDWEEPETIVKTVCTSAFALFVLHLSVTCVATVRSAAAEAVRARRRDRRLSM